MAKKEYTDEFQGYLDLIKEDYKMYILFYDTMEFLQKDTRAFKGVVTRETVEKKIKAYETLFPMFKI